MRIIFGVFRFDTVLDFSRAAYPCKVQICKQITRLPFSFTRDVSPVCFCLADLLRQTVVGWGQTALRRQASPALCAVLRWQVSHPTYAAFLRTQLASQRGPFRVRLLSAVARRTELCEAA